MAALPAEEERFHANLLSFIDLVHELITSCHRLGKTTMNPGIISFARNILNDWNKTEMIENFIEYSYEFWDEISEKDEHFFLENCGKIFKDIPGNHVNAFRELFEARDETGHSIIIDDDKAAMWDYFDGFIKICIKYIHRERKPSIKDGRPNYGVEAFQYVRLEHYASVWGIVLEWK